MKRFYTVVTSAPAVEGHEIRLDGKAIKTPSRKLLLAPNEALAAELVREWSSQGGEILPATMPLTQILTTALDRVAAERAAMQAAALAYLDTDLLCYRASHPRSMVERQAALWDPWLAWFEETYGVELKTSDHLRAHKQPPAAHRAAEKAVADLDNLRFTLLQLVVSLSGSLVLGLAFTGHRADAGQIFEAMHAEENVKAEIYQAHVYGLSPHEDQSRAAVKRDLDAAQLLLKTL
jgi:chaperone required for assembly of F1-ATPase